jgi:predicted transcriptional regulator
MGRASEGDAWVTIMSNVNIVAVSTLADPACIVLSEGVLPDDDTLVRAKEQGINILTTSLDTFDACVRIASAL